MAVSSSSTFSIRPAQERDAAAINQVQRASWLATYPNAALGITEDWIHAQCGQPDNPEAIEQKRQWIAEARYGGPVLYQVVENGQGQVCGFMVVRIKDAQAEFTSIYLLPEAQGSGVADELMRLADTFIGPRPVSLEVADYNTRAIRFYERHGFKTAAGSQHIYREKIPVITMERRGGN